MNQTKTVNHVLEDMLLIHVSDYPKKWEDYLHLVEFAYNNHYQASTKLSPYEILYGRKFNTPITWTNSVDIFMKEIFHLHGIPKVIISDRDPKFTGNFWKSLFKGLDTKLNYSTA